MSYMKNLNKKLYWTPRILGVVFILFVSLFALDVFGSGYGFWKTIVAFFIHLAPAYVLVVVLYIAWRWELVGGFIFLFLALYYILTVNANFLYKLPIAAPLMLIGGLFIWSKYSKNKIQ